MWFPWQCWQFIAAMKGPRSEETPHIRAHLTAQQDRNQNIDSSKEMPAWLEQEESGLHRWIFSTCCRESLYLIFSLLWASIFLHSGSQFLFLCSNYFLKLPHKHNARKQPDIFHLLPGQQLKDREEICPEEGKASLASTCKLLPIFIYLLWGVLNIMKKFRN